VNVPVSKSIAAGHVRTHFPAQNGKKIIMQKKIALGLTMLALVAAAPLLSACHTTAGAGQDISATGQAIDKAAVKATP
jgi:predicted small secreted protein